MSNIVTLADAIVERRFDDLRPDMAFQIGTVSMSRESAIAFAREYDPQPFHLDDAAAAANPVFGRLSASGWHTALLTQMLVSDYMQASGLKPLAGGGLDDMKWLKPVFPPITLYCTAMILAVRPSVSRPERGIMTIHSMAEDEHGERVISTTLTGIFAR